MTPALDRIAALASTSDPDLDLGRAALTIALLEYPDLDFEPSLRRLDELAAEARGTVAEASGPRAEVEALGTFLHDVRGFRGNQSDYYDPRNSFLNDVLERRTGIPITLAVVYCELGRRLGMPLVGVGFPGHFLVRHEGPPEVVFDPFTGRSLGPEDCRRLVEAVTGESEELDERWLRPARPREIVIRMLRNLKLAWLRLNDARRALDATSGILLFHPDDAAELRDRGVLHLQLECFSAALADLERFLEKAPADPAAERIRDMLPDLQRRVASLQ